MMSLLRDPSMTEAMDPANAWGALCHSKTMQRHGDGFLRALPARLGGAMPIGQISEKGEICLAQSERHLES